MIIKNGDIIRFWKKVSVGATDECDIYNGATDKDGYGQFYADGHQIKAHRFSYMVNDGYGFREIPKGILVCHKCDNPPCVKNSHLFLGTHAVNHADRNAKGRQASGDRNGARTKPGNMARGSSHPNHKLDEDQVRVIREVHAKTDSAAEIARMFGVTYQNVRSILIRKTWKHI